MRPLAAMISKPPPSFDQQSTTFIKYTVSNVRQSTITNDRVFRRRASRACQCCRERKVRCNIVEYGPPCTNCRLDEVSCIVAQQKRRPKHNFNSTESLDQTHESLNPHRHLPGISDFEAPADGTANHIDAMSYDFGKLSDTGSLVQDRGDDQILKYDVPPTLCQAQMQDLDWLEYVQTTDFDHTPPGLSFDSIDPMYPLDNDILITRYTTPASPNPPLSHTLPAYLKPFPQHLTTDEVHILRRKNALSMPESTFRNELLQNYIEHVHPCMPLIDILEILRVIHENGKAGKMSLMLYQAVMLAGTAFIDMDQLYAAGFANRREAQNSFYQRCRVLYDIDYETDHIALIQSLLLMTYFHHSPDDLKGTRHWLDIAISFAYRTGLHRNPDKSSLDIKKKRLLKRIWWSCLMKDRLVSLETRGPLGIKDEDFDTPMLILEDFEIEALPGDNSIISSALNDPTIQTDLALICIEKARLCLCIGHVISIQYPLLIGDHEAIQRRSISTRSSSRLFPKKWDREHAEKVLDCDFELSNWLDNLPTRFRRDGSSVKEHEKDRSRIFLQQSLLHMVYFATISALHEPQSLSAAGVGKLQNGCDLQDLSLLRVREASKAIATIGLDLHKLRLERYLPTAAAAILVLATAHHLLDMQSPITSNEEDSVERSYQCISVLEKLQGAFPAAGYAIEFLGPAIRKSDLDIAVGRMEKRSGLPESGMGSAQSTLMEKEDRVTPNPSSPNAVARAVGLEELSDLSQRDTHPFAPSHCVTDFINMNDNSGEGRMQDVSSEESPFSTFPSRNYDKLDAKRPMAIYNGTESHDGFETFIDSDTDDCTSSLSSNSECADVGG